MIGNDILLKSNAALPGVDQAEGFFKSADSDIVTIDLLWMGRCADRFCNCKLC